MTALAILAPAALLALKLAGVFGGLLAARYGLKKLADKVLS
jgi:hypothetical protein